ncbi:histidine kinase [Paenibacillus sp. KQZ6P-2]|uniref:Histidine kinase n=1 Tax=Paenibacillus mangrovi TaxID=2931978 RepID=A0A9X2B2K5_9BACL|nr:histidine kinase [Paenibacillus mangrovi]MCJ8012659.1 histidine kinase [Paenibacillus mangrovi]
MQVQRRRFTIYPKLLIAFLTAILPVYMLGIFLNQQVANSLREHILQSMQSNVKFYLTSLTDEIQRIDKFKQSLVVDEDLMTLGAVAPALSENELREAILRLEKKLSLFKDSSSYIADVTCYIPSIDKRIKPDNYADGVPVDELSQIRSKMKHQTSPLLWWNNKLLLYSLYPEYSFSDRPPAYLVEIEIDQDMIVKDLNNVIDQGQGGALLYFHNSNRYIVNHTIDGLTDELQKLVSREEGSNNYNEVLEHSGKRYLVSMQTSPEYEMTLAIYTPEALIMSDFDKFNALFWVLFMLSVIVIILFSYWIFKAIRNPLRKMVDAFHRVEQGDLSIRTSHDSHDEFRDLSDQFNNMAHQLQSLIQEVYEQQIRSQQSELKQLQSQINPHFLYNSFFILHQLIEFEDVDKAKEFVSYLGHYFQFITRDANSELLLGQEVKHAESYINIQTMRFGDRIQVMLDPIPIACESLYVPRLILQPIIENAYMHGLESKASQGILRISNSVENHSLYIRFEDNGISLTDDGLSQLTDKLAMTAKSGIETTGIVNVHRRLQIKFGSLSGLEVYRNDMGGLGVTMKIPLTKEDER